MVPEKGLSAFLKRPFQSESEKETLALARRLGRALRPGTVAALTGEIGSGKTVFIKGLARGLGVKNSGEVKSPTFVLLHLYEGRVPIQHFDLYRLEKGSELDTIGFDEFLANPAAVSLVEWADRAPRRIPPGALWVRLEVTGPTSRRITLR